LNSTTIAKLVETYKLPKFRGAQLRKAFFEQQVTKFQDVSTLSLPMRQTLAAEQRVLSFDTEAVFKASDGRAYKALLLLPDGNRIETVLLNPKPGLWSCCISSQVGCGLACTFCATGKLGLSRNLTAEEISDQVLFWRQYICQQRLDARLSNVVYMGMGEPMQNRREVFASLTELMNPDTFGIGARHLSVSTVGLVKPMKEFTDQFPQVNLALSLHAANDTLRERLMPVNKSQPLAALREALQYHADETNRKIFLEYILLSGENDSAEHAEELVRYVRSFDRPALLHTNLIVYNPTDSDHQASARERARAFRDQLEAAGLSVTIRRNLGRDIDAACGQLALKAGETPGYSPSAESSPASL